MFNFFYLENIFMQIKKNLFFNARIHKSISIFIKAHIISDRYVRILLHYLSFQV